MTLFRSFLGGKAKQKPSGTERCLKKSWRARTETFTQWLFTVMQWRVTLYYSPRVYMLPCQTPATKTTALMHFPIMSATSCHVHLIHVMKKATSKELVRHKKYCLFSLNLNTPRKRFCNSRRLARGMAVAWRIDNKTPTGYDFSCIVIKKSVFLKTLNLGYPIVVW